MLDDEDPQLSASEERALQELRNEDDAKQPWLSKWKGLGFLVPILGALAFLVLWRESPLFKSIVGLLGTMVIMVAVSYFFWWIRPKRPDDPYYRS